MRRVNLFFIFIAVISVCPFLAYSKNCDDGCSSTENYHVDSNLWGDNFDHFKSIIVDKKCSCWPIDHPYFDVNEDLLIDEEIMVVYPDGDPLKIDEQIISHKAITIAAQKTETKQYFNVYFQNIEDNNVPFRVENKFDSNAVESLTLNNVKFTNSTLTDYSVYVGPKTSLDCNQCENTDNANTTGQFFTVYGAANFYLGSITGKKTPIYIHTPDQVNITDLFFNSPPVVVGLSGSATIHRNEFLLSGKPAIKIGKIPDTEPQEHVQVVMIYENIYKNSDGMDLSKIIDSEDGTVHKSLDAPAIELIGTDEKDYLISIKSPGSILSPGDAGESGKWGDMSCPGQMWFANVIFEPYFLKYQGTKLIGVYPILHTIHENIGEKNIIKIDTGIQVKDKDGTVVAANLKDKDISILAHCAGTGTTPFSNVIKLKKCETGYEWDVEGASCVKKTTCSSNGECDIGKLCDVVQGVCFKPDCDEDKDCGLQVCKDYHCVDKVCAADSDCTASYFCSVVEGGVCKHCSSLGAVEKMCSDGKQPLGVNKICLDMKPSTCPINSSETSQCGGVCICKSGFEKYQGRCVIKGTQKLCPEDGQKPVLAESGEWICGLAASITPLPAKKGGGCSLRR